MRGGDSGEVVRQQFAVEIIHLISTDCPVALCSDAGVCLMNVLRRRFRQKTSYIRVFYIRSPLRLGSVLSSSCLFMFGSQVEEQRYLLPAHSHFITVSHCITAVELLQCCLLIADSAHCCSSRGLVWNAIICSPQLLSFSSDFRLVGCCFQGVLSVNIQCLFSKDAVLLKV